MPLAFEYDTRKAAANLKKHGVSFAEAMTAFNDPFAETFPDELPSDDETRFITIADHHDSGCSSFRIWKRMAASD